MTLKRNIVMALALGLVLAAVFPREARAQRLAVKTNALSWAALAPDLGVEVITGERTSVALSVFGTYTPFGLPYKMLVLQPEFRFWFNGRPLTREYIGVSAFGVTYDISFPVSRDGTQHLSNVYQGDGIALGLSGGYVFNLSKRWNFELSGGTGLLLFSQKQYFSVNPDSQYVAADGTSNANTWGYKLFPVKLAATFIYIIK